MRPNAPATRCTFAAVGFAAGGACRVRQGAPPRRAARRRVTCASRGQDQIRMRREGERGVASPAHSSSAAGGYYVHRHVIAPGRPDFEHTQRTHSANFVLQGLGCQGGYTLPRVYPPRRGAGGGGTYAYTPRTWWQAFWGFTTESGRPLRTMRENALRTNKIYSKRSGVLLSC